MPNTHLEKTVTQRHKYTVNTVLPLKVNQQNLQSLKYVHKGAILSVT